MPTDLLGQIHSSTAVTSSPWVDFRSEVTGMYLLSGQGGEWGAQHLIREYNRNIHSLYRSWTGSWPDATGLFLEPYNAGFSYQGTGNFGDLKWNLYSLAFDGIDDYARVNNTSDLDFGTDQDFSIGLWFNTTANGGWGKEMIEKQCSGVFYQIRGPKSTNGKIRIQIDDDVAQTSLYSASGNLNDGNWHHVICVRDYGNTLDMYVDGTLSNTTVDVTASVSNTGLFIIGVGGGADNILDNFFEGNIDEVGVWRRTLSASEISGIYNSGTPQSLASSSPVAWWRMGDGDTYPTLKDSSTNNYNGTMENMTASDIVVNTP